MMMKFSNSDDEFSVNEDSDKFVNSSDETEYILKVRNFVPLLMLSRVK
jgi:hypothetical protein